MYSMYKNKSNSYVALKGYLPTLTVNNLMQLSLLLSNTYCCGSKSLCWFFASKTSLFCCKPNERQPCNSDFFSNRSFHLNIGLTSYVAVIISITVLQSNFTSLLHNSQPIYHVCQAFIGGTTPRISGYSVRQNGLQLLVVAKI